MLLDRLQAPGPKRILALDGGGIRGAITIEFLDSMLSEHRDRGAARRFLRQLLDPMEDAPCA